MKLGLISDTHGFFDPRLSRIFRGVDHILHAGDIGPDHLIVQLESIAPVTAVLGNTDSSAMFRLTETVELAKRKFLIHHIVTPGALTEELRTRIARVQPAAVIFGHTHRQHREMVDGVLFVNPGYAGKPKPGTERGVALMELDGMELNVSFVSLPTE